MRKPTVTVLGKRELFHQAFFKWFEVQFKYDRFDGSESKAIEQLVLDRGDSVGILLHDVDSDEVILVEQVRVATIDSGTGWLLEIPAGRVDTGEDPRAAALREVREETGAEPSEIKLVSSFFLSPGGCSERLHLFYCPFREGLKIDPTGGLAEENEDIRVHRIGLRDALAKIEAGEIVDAKSILGLLWIDRPPHAG